MKPFKNILLISDFHIKKEKNALEALQKIKEILVNDRIDFVFFLGDYFSLKAEEQKDNVLIKSCIDTINVVNGFIFKEFSKNFFFLPGNHDPNVLFSPSKPSGIKCGTNLHKSSFALSESISVVGFGGSPPSFTIPKSPKFPKIKTWDGYPYTTKEKLDTDLEKFVKDDNINVLFEKKKVVLLTHFGPNVGTNTSIFHTEEGVKLSTGSDYLSKVLHKKSAVANFHGHVHVRVYVVCNVFKIGEGRVKYDRNTNIVNPGPLKAGCFAVVGMDSETGEIVHSKHCKFERS